MSISVNPDWWKALFDEVYLLTDARSVCDDGITRLEVDVICDLLPIETDHRIIDLCGGQGRHSFELYSRGYKDCTVLDYSEYLIGMASTLARRKDYALECIQTDARNTGLPSASFDHTLILGNSLGYINPSDGDVHILQEAFRLLRPGGWLLVDVTDGAIVKKAFRANAWHEIGDDTVVCRERELAADRINVREMVLNKTQGIVRDETYSVRLYERETITSLLERVGAEQVKVHTGFAAINSKKDYGFMNHRMIAVGQKR